jgi:thioredoxin
MRSEPRGTVPARLAAGCEPEFGFVGSYWASGAPGACPFRGEGTMATVKITASNFVETIKQGKIVLFDWWAPWCGPCRAFGPIYERVAAKHPDAVFGKINTEEEPELANQFGIRSIPTLMIFRDETLLFARPGMVPEKALEDLIEQAERLDMEEVRRKIAAEEVKHAATA